MKTTERSKNTPEHAYRLMMQKMREGYTPEEELDEEHDGGVFANADAVIEAFMDEFQGDLIETMREIAKADPTDFEGKRDALFSKIEGLLRNQMIRGLTALVLVGRGDDHDVA